MARKPSRPIVIALASAGVAATVVAGVAIAPRLVDDTGPPAPVAWVSIEDRGDSTLVRFDLRAAPTSAQAAVRRQDRQSSGQWTVDPTGAAIGWVTSGSDRSRVEIAAGSTGAAVWSTNLSGILTQPLLWSRDGRYAVGITTEFEAGGAGIDRVALLDVQEHAMVEQGIKPGWLVLGFAADQRSVVLAADEGEPGGASRWSFLAMNLATGAVGPASASELATDPVATLPIGVSTLAGAALETQAVPDDTGAGAGQRLVRRPLGASTTTEIAAADRSISWSAFSPSGGAIFYGVLGPEDADGSPTETVSVAVGSQPPREIWTGTFHGAPTFSPGADLLGLLDRRAGRAVVLVDPISADHVTLTLPDDADDFRLVALTGGRLPVVDSVAWTPPETPRASAGPLVAGAPRPLGRFTERAEAGGTRTRLGWLAPAEGGTLEVEASSDPIDAADTESVAVILGPAGVAFAVVGDGDAPARLVRWDGSGTKTTTLPVGWAVEPVPAISPDGASIAGLVDGSIGLLDLETRRERRVAIPAWDGHDRWYGAPAGWADGGRAIVLGQTSFCTDYCGFAYPPFVVLDLETGKIRAVSPQDPIDGRSVVDGSIVGIHTGEWARSVNVAGTLRLTPLFESETGEREIRLPEAFGWAGDADTTLVWSATGRRLYLAAPADGLTTVAGMDAPVADDPTLDDLGGIPSPYGLAAVDATEAWAIVERAGAVRALANLADGIVYEPHPDWSVVGFRPGPQVGG